VLLAFATPPKWGGAFDPAAPVEWRIMPKTGERPHFPSGGTARTIPGSAERKSGSVPVFRPVHFDRVQEDRFAQLPPCIARASGRGDPALVHVR